jgi:hypothetical protein
MGGTGGGVRGKGVKKVGSGGGGDTGQDINLIAKQIRKISGGSIYVKISNNKIIIQPKKNIPGINLSNISSKIKDAKIKGLKIPIMNSSVGMKPPFISVSIK